MFCIRLHQVFRVYYGATRAHVLCFMIKIALATAESVDLAHYTPSPCPDTGMQGHCMGSTNQ